MKEEILVRMFVVIRYLANVLKLLLKPEQLNIYEPPQGFIMGRFVCRGCPDRFTG